MKVLRVINSLNIGGAERSIAGNVPLHVQNGVDIEVLLLNGNETFFLKELEKHNVKVHFLGKNNSVYNPILIFKLFRYINKYDIIHVSLFPALYWLALAKILFSSKSKLIFTEHNTHNKRMNNFLFRMIDKILYKQYQSIVAISPEVNFNLSKHLGHKYPIITIYNGVDISKIKQAHNRKEKLDFIPSNKKLLLQVSGFRAQKDQDTLIRALALLPIEFHLLLIGDGPRIDICKALAKSLNVQERITFLGLQHNVEDILHSSDIVILSSHWEGFGRSAVEGMAAGKPVIASNVEGLSQIVEGAGLLFEVGDYIALSGLILDLSSSDLIYKEVAQKCLERAHKYDIRKMVDSYEQLYRALCSD